MAGAEVDHNAAIAEFCGVTGADSQAVSRKRAKSVHAF